MSELNQNLNEAVNTGSQTETQTTTTITQDDELKITFLGRGRTVSDTVTKTIDQVTQGIPNKLNTKDKVVVLPETVVITKDGVEYSMANKNLSVNVDIGGFYATGGVDLTGGVAQYKYIKNDIGLCSVMQVGGKTYIFDVGLESDCAQLLAFLEKNNVSKIDGMIITHFHGDHIGTTDPEKGGKGFYKLLTEKANLFVADDTFPGCKFYFPHQSNNKLDNGTHVFLWDCLNDNNYKLRYENMSKLIEGKTGTKQVLGEIISPSYEGYTVNIDDQTCMKFYNVDKSFYGTADGSDGYFHEFTNYITGENFNTNKPRYNNFSMVSVIEHGNNKIALVGDIEEAAQKNVANAILGVDVLQVEHHGFNHYSDKDYINNLSAKIGVIPAYDYWRNNRLSQSTANKIISNGGDVYYTGDCGNVTVHSNGKRVYVDHTLKPIKTFNSMSSGIVLVGDGNEDLKILPVGVYSFASAAVLSRVANNPSLITTAGKVIVEYISANLKARKVTVIANATNGIVATMLYRSSGGNMSWTNWQYSYPYNPS